MKYNLNQQIASVESSKGHMIKICNNYGYGDQNMQIPWDFRTSELLLFATALRN